MEKMERQFTFRLDELKQDKYEITSQGFLKCDAFVTRAGIFVYHDEKGNPVREYRSPEEVFKQDSMDTLKMIPVTYHHPADKKVTVDNVRDYQVGITGENVFQKDTLLACKVLITDKKTIKDVLDHHKRGESVELSCGYDAEVVMISGVHPQEGHYDAIQRNIRYDHLSIVELGRAGSKVKLKLDRKEDKVIQFIKKAIKIDGFQMDAINEEAPKEAKGILDRLSGKLDDAVQYIQDQAGKIKDLVKKTDEAQAKIDTLTAENKTLKTENDVLKNPAGAIVQAIIKDRKAIETVADGLEIKTDGMDDKAVKVAVIQKAAPDFKADGKSDDYINARYDAVVEVIAAAKKDGNNGKLGEFIFQAKKDAAKTKVDHRQAFIEKSKKLASGKQAAA